MSHSLLTLNKVETKKKKNKIKIKNKIVLQIRYSLVVIFELNSVPGVQYKDVMMINDGKYQQE